jgi:hypothetical protein
VSAGGNDPGSRSKLQWPSMKMLAGLGVLAAICGVLVLPPANSATGTAATRCPVTTAGSTKKPPAVFVSTGMPVPYVRTWLGNRAIWVRLPRHGILPALYDPREHAMSVKFPWWRVLGGQLHAWAHPVGQAGPRLEADVAAAADYGPTGFVPSFLRFSQPGCWKVTGSLRGHTISFVTRVIRHAP